MKNRSRLTIDSTGRLAWILDGRTVPVVRGGDETAEAPEAALPEELAERVAGMAEISDEDLGQLEADLLAHLDEVTDVDEVDDAVLAEATVTRDAVRAVRNDAQRRYDDAAEAEAESERRRSELEAIRAEVAPEEGDDADDGDVSAEGEGEGEGPAASPEVTSEPSATPAEAEAQPEPVAAAAAPAARPRVGRVNARRPQARAPRPAAATSRLRTRLVAAADVPGFAAGQEVTVDQLPELLMRRIEAVGRHNGSGSWQVASLRWDYPNEWELGDDLGTNEARIRQATDPQALAAAGGYCAPPQPDYSVIQISDNERRVPNALTRFGAGRGGVIFVPPPKLGDYDAGVDDWSHTNDVTPSDPTTKPCVSVDCDSPTTVYTDAITQCLEVGNFIARTYDERVQAIIQLLNATQARHAESLELTRIGSGSTQVTTGQGLGAAADFLAHIGLAVAAERMRYRMPASARLRLMLPDFVHAMIRADIVRQIPGTGTMDEKLAIADAQIDGAFAAHGVNVTWLLDTEAGSAFGAQGDGALVGWPTSVVGYLFHEGAWLFLDGGELNLGVVRDSTLNETNDFRIFSEVWEQVAFRGIFSRRISFDVCPSGWTSAPVDYDPCSTGS